MDNTKTLESLDIRGGKRNENLAFDFFVQIPQRLQNCLKPHFKQLAKYGERAETALSVAPKVNCGYSSIDANLEKQLQAWKENPTWVDHSPEIKVSVPKGSLCNLNVKFNVGLPPDAVYNIVIDPDNRRVFKNIKEVISRRVLVDEGLRQVVEVEQAALWRFLWWSGTISVHVVVDQNRIDHSVRFKQQKTGFMKRFEGCWRVEPLFVDEQLCSPIKPRTWADYESCSGGKGRVGSVVSLEQLIQPALLPPPPLSWYLRGITTRTTEMLISDLLAETARLRGGIDKFGGELAAGYNNPMQGCENYCDVDLKERWRQRRNMRRRRRNSRRKLIPSP